MSLEQENAAEMDWPTVDSVDRIPIGGTAKAQRAFVQSSPEERAAAYLKSIRRMMVFFTVVAVVALVGVVVLGIIEVVVLSSIHSSQIPSAPFG